MSNSFRTGPWWWLFTAETLANTCVLFDVTVEQTWIHYRSASVLARLGTASCRPDPWGGS